MQKIISAVALTMSTTLFLQGCKDSPDDLKSCCDDAVKDNKKKTDKCMTAVSDCVNKYKDDITKDCANKTDADNKCGNWTAATKYCAANTTQCTGIPTEDAL